MTEIVSSKDLIQALTGARPLPVNIALSMNFQSVAGGEARDVVQSITSLHTTASFFQTVAALVESASLPTADRGFQEVGVMAFVYQDGSYEAKAYTSGLWDHADGRLHFDAIEQSRVLDEIDQGRVPVAAVHFHSHPGPEFRPADAQDCSTMMSDSDLGAYEQISTFLSAYAGTAIPVTGVVRPVGRDCGDVLIDTEMGPNNHDHAMIQKAILMKIRRGLERLEF